MSAPESSYRWGTVTLVPTWPEFTPLQIQLDGDVEPLPIQPETMVPAGRMPVGTRVWVQLHGHRVIILGAHHGGPNLFRNFFDETTGVQAPNSVGYNAESGDGSVLTLSGAAPSIPQWQPPVTMDWTNGGLTVRTDAGTPVMSSMAALVGATGWGLRVVRGRVDLALQFTYDGPTKTAGATANIGDYELCTISDSSLWPDRPHGMWIGKYGFAQLIGRVQTDGRVLLTAGMFPGQELASGEVTVVMEASWPRT